MSPRSEVLADLREMFSTSLERELAYKKERLRLKLALNMASAREFVGLSQQQVADQLGVSQPWVSKLESPNYDHQIESIFDFVFALDGEISLALKVAGAVFHVSDFEPEVTIDLTEWPEYDERQTAMDDASGDTCSSKYTITEDLSTADEFTVALQSVA